MKDSTNRDIALIVHSCDRYEFLYKGFDIFFSRHWDFDIPCNYYFATEEKMASINGFVNIRSGKGEWSERLFSLLNAQIKEKYILYFQEDMWLNKKVNAAFFIALFNLVAQNNWKQVKLHSSEVYKTTPTDFFIEGFNISKVDNALSGYLMSHQVTLWDKELLLTQLSYKEHPWRNERRGTKRLRKLDPEIYHVDYFSENGKPEINENRSPVARSEYHTVSENGMLKDGIQKFVFELSDGTDEQRKYAKELEYHYTNKLTHDGKVKPRKEDLLQKIKRLLKS